MVLIVGQNSVWQNTYNLHSLTTGSVNRVANVFASAAGKGSNVARALLFLGENPLLLAYVGGANGEKFRRACQEDEIPTVFTEIAGETRICTTLIEDGGRITEVVEPAPPVSQREAAAFRAAFERHLPEAEMLVISGTAMNGEPQESYLELVRIARRAGVPTVLDSYRSHGSRALEASPEVLKINSEELAELSGMECRSPSERASAAKSIREKFGIAWVIITRGKNGAEGFSEGPPLGATAPPIELVNAIGSGDSFTAGVVHTLLDARRRGPEGRRTGFPWTASLSDALRCGTAMGSANCLNIKPALIERPDYDHLHAAIEVSELIE